MKNRYHEFVYDDKDYDEDGFVVESGQKNPILSKTAIYNHLNYAAIYDYWKKWLDCTKEIK